MIFINVRLSPVAGMGEHWKIERIAFPPYDTTFPRGKRSDSKAILGRGNHCLKSIILSFSVLFVHDSLGKGVWHPGRKRNPPPVRKESELANENIWRVPTTAENTNIRLAFPAPIVEIHVNGLRSTWDDPGWLNRLLEGTIKSFIKQIHYWTSVPCQP